MGGHQFGLCATLRQSTSSVRSWTRLAGCAGLVALMVVAGCHTPTKRDLSANPEIYVYTDYAAEEPAPHPVFVARPSDRRGETKAAVEASGPFPVMVFPDAIWETRVPEMLQKIVRTELRESRVFPDVVEAKAPTAYTLRLDIVKFYSAVREEVSGGRSYSEAEFLVKVFAPGAGQSAQPVFERAFASRQATGWKLQATDPRLLLGRCTRDVIGQMLLALDQSDFSGAEASDRADREEPADGAGN